MMYTGTTASQDTRFSDKEKKLLKQMKFDDSLTQKVDMTKVKLDVIKPWITTKITQILGIEDDVMIGYVNNQLEEKTHSTSINGSISVILKLQHHLTYSSPASSSSSSSSTSLSKSSRR
ncbi:hypothetical protein PV325_000466 [Microctonus aethiopoides]|nr:hypothetical protein PV325_000466 [Microctonus aethiopoides]